MCRLLGIVSHTETTLPSALGDDFESFVQLSAGLHSDGWGFAGESAAGRTVTIAAEPAHSSQSFAQLLGTTEITSGITHLRAATLGLPVSEANTHPFTHGELSFAHNGSIREISSIEPLIDDDLRGEILGDTDSERYLLALVSELRRRDTVDAIRTVARRIGEVAEEASLNALLLTPEHLVIVADDAAKAPSFLPADYYELSYRIGEGFTAVASSGWAQHGWERVPERSILTIDRRTQQLSIHSLDAAPSILATSRLDLAA